MTLRDVGTLVGSAAVAASLVRANSPWGTIDGGSPFLWWTLAALALTSGGPFLYPDRRFGRRRAGYPRSGARLWAWLGLRWVVAAPVRAFEISWGWNNAVPLGLIVVGVTLATLLVAGEAWSRSWKLITAEHGPTSSTERVGMSLAAAFPLQWGLALTVLGRNGRGRFGRGTMTRTGNRRQESSRRWAIAEVSDITGKNPQLCPNFRAEQNLSSERFAWVGACSRDEG